MSDAPIPLTANSIKVDSAEFAAIRQWPFADPYVGRLLRHDIPQRVELNNCTIWAYRDPQGRFVGFGTLDVALDCVIFTAGQSHPYIPLLAVNPTIKSLGYGTSIVRHLIEEAALLSLRTTCHDVLFLDVYTSNTKPSGFMRKQVSPRLLPSPSPILTNLGRSIKSWLVASPSGSSHLGR